MTKFFIIHGTQGNPAENWFPWLKEKLEEDGHTIFVPKFSTPENQSLQKWLEEFEDYLHHIDNDTIMIGHSLGPAFILSILELIKEPVKAVFFVAGFISSLGLPEFDELNKTFTDKQFDWNLIKNHCNKFYVIQSSNDPYVPMEKAKELASKLDTRPIVIDNAGHFNASAGFTEFSWLLNQIKSLTKH